MILALGLGRSHLLSTDVKKTLRATRREMTSIAWPVGTRVREAMGGGRNGAFSGPEGPPSWPQHSPFEWACTEADILATHGIPQDSARKHGWSRNKIPTPAGIFGMREANSATPIATTRAALSSHRICSHARRTDDHLDNDRSQTLALEERNKKLSACMHQHCPAGEMTPATH